MAFGILVSSLIVFSFAKKQEGKQLPSSFRNWNGGKTVLSAAARGVRNNNPGNLIKTSIAWNGKVPHEQNTDSRFEQFLTPEYGIRALIKDVTNDIKKGKNTITKVISEFAPFFENNTKAYIASVASNMGVGADTPLKADYATLKQLVMAIDKHENASNNITSELFSRAWAIL